MSPFGRLKPSAPCIRPLPRRRDPLLTVANGSLQDLWAPDKALKNYACS
jgi:hypothetical protein